MADNKNLNNLDINDEFTVNEEDVKAGGVSSQGVLDENNNKNNIYLSDDDKEFINLILTKDLESLDKRKVSKILVSLGYESIVNEEDYVFDEEKFYEELEKKQKEGDEGDSKDKKSKKPFKIPTFVAVLLTLAVTATACLVPSYNKFKEQETLHQAEIEKLNTNLNDMKEENNLLVVDKEDYISYLETLMQKCNMYYGGEIKLELYRDTNTNKLMVKDIDAKNLDSYMIDKYTRSWGDKREFTYDSITGKLIYLGPEK